ncbi:UNVERIFIED_CONTAM: hypothetical protein GTU68_015567 [Idotea baltica]|nr:hypothetical protein [Idotea baltica]
MPSLSPFSPPISLAIADLLFTVFCVPFTASDYIFNEWPFGVLWCKVVQYLTYVTAYASVYTLLLLSFDRYLAVVHPIYAITSELLLLFLAGGVVYDVIGCCFLGGRVVYDVIGCYCLFIVDFWGSEGRTIGYINIGL